MSRPIIAGYEWRQRVRAIASPPLFPVGCTLTGQVRASASSAELLATVSTATGTITRVDDDTVELRLPAADSAAWRLREVVCDLVRTDTTPDLHCGFRLRIRVVQPVTRGLP